MGASIGSEQGKAPLTITGGSLTGIEWRPPVASAQIKSALMLAALSAHGSTVVHEIQATRDHSELAFPAFGLQVSTNGLSVTVSGAPGGDGAARLARSRCLATPRRRQPGRRLPPRCRARHVNLTGVGLNARRLGFVNALRSPGRRHHDRSDAPGRRRVGRPDPGRAWAPRPRHARSGGQCLISSTSCRCSPLVRRWAGRWRSAAPRSSG